MDSQAIFSLEAYYVEDGTIIDKKTDSQLYSKKDRLKYSEGLVLPIQLKKDQKIDVYMKINNFNLIIIPAKIVTKNELIHYNASLNIWQGIFFGIIIIMFFFNLIIYFMTKFKAYLFYIGYLFSLALYFSTYHGYMKSFDSFNIFLITGAFSTVIFLLLFVKEFLSLKKNFSTIVKAFNYSIYLTFFSLIVFIFFYISHQYIYALYIFNLYLILLPFVSILITYTAYYLAYKGQHTAKYFAVTWTFLLIASTLSILLPYNGICIYNHSVFNSILQSTLVFESIAFAIILALRLKEIKKERVSQREMIIQQNKLVSMGQMINNIAHQWRQPLSVINAIVWTIDIKHKNKTLNSETIESNLQEIENITQYLSNTINDFMNFFSPNKNKEVFYINKSIDKAIHILSLPNDIIEVKSRENYKVNSFESEFIQCIMIVLNNSKDAMKNNLIKNPKITIIIEEKDKNIHMSIKDNGGGVPKNILNNIFEPYFTTKHQIQGTGLGLYITKMIIENSMNGQIIAKNINNGFCVKFIIPQD